MGGQGDLQTGMQLLFLLPHYTSPGGVALGEPSEPPSIVTAAPPTAPADEAKDATPYTPEDATVTWGTVGVYDRRAARLQMKALIDAGFTITFDDPFLCGFACELSSSAPFNGCGATGGEKYLGLNLCTLPPTGDSSSQERMSYFLGLMAVSPPLEREPYYDTQPS